MPRSPWRRRLVIVCAQILALILAFTLGTFAQKQLGLSFTVDGL
ncbi:MAG: hypothetical protein AAF648_13155 [Pseudomonadota bacterium]